MTRRDRLTLCVGLALPWLFIWQGLDFTDQGYLATGYRCFFRYPETTEDSGHMWLTNLVGATWDALFGDLGLISIRALWSLCLSAGLLLAFRFVRSLTSERAAALAVLVTSVFLSNRRETWFSYNTASSLVVTCAVLCLLKGIAERRTWLLFTGGAIIGAAPFARFPNVLSFALISVIGFAALLDSERRRTVWKDLGFALAGLTAGVLTLLLAIYLRGDTALYFRGLHSLFEPAMQKSGYSSDDLQHKFIIDEVLAVACGLAVCLVSTVLSRALARIPNAVGLLLLALTATVGIYGLTSSNDERWRWVVPGTVYFVLGGIACGVWQRALMLRVAAWALLIVVLVAPLGSNLGIKNAHMGLWVALPFTLASVWTLEARFLAGQAQKLALMTALVLAGEAVHWAWTYTYRDGPRRSLLSGFNDPQLRGQFTTEARARSVSEVLSALEQRVAPDDYLLAYEGTPLLQYLTKTRPYLNRPWLMGWEQGSVVRRLAAEAPARTGCLPVAVVTLESARSFVWPAHDRKLEVREAQRGTRKALKSFLRSHHYKRTWGNDFFEILEPLADKRISCR